MLNKTNLIDVVFIILRNSPVALLEALLARIFYI